MGHHPDPRSFLFISAIVLVGLVGRALNRHHIRGKGVSAEARVLSVEAQKSLHVPSSDVFYVVQLAIPRSDGAEIVAAVTVFSDPPQPGWTVGVRYLERLGNTTKVATVGPFKPIAEAEPLS